MLNTFTTIIITVNKKPSYC